MPSIGELQKIFSREQPSFDTWNDGSRSGNGNGNGNGNGKTNPFEDSSADESKVVGRGGGGGGANPFSDSYSMETSSASALFPGAVGMNPFDESTVESKVDNNNNRRNNSNNQRPPRHSWDSDREFPVMEISRIRTKTKKLREGRTKSNNGVPKVDASSIFRDEGFGGAGSNAFAAVQNSATNTTGGSSMGKSARKNKTSSAWSTSDGSSFSKQPDSLDDVMNQQGESSTVEGNVNANNSKSKNNAGLARVDEQRSTSDSTGAASARKAQQNLIQGFHKRGTTNKQHRTALALDDPPITGRNVHALGADGTLNTSDRSTEATNASGESLDKNLTLHDLCGEATATDDIAWRNALYLLSVQPHLSSISDEGWTPLHICCLGQSPPPSFMVRALLYCNRRAVREVDDGDRLPLHLVAASSGDVETMQLLVEEYPQGVYQLDSHGQTPLHLLIRNLAVELTADKARVLLGLTLPESADMEQQKRVLQRRGEHLELRFEELNRMLTRSTPVTTLERDRSHEATFSLYPEDVQMALKKLEQWKKKQRKEGSAAAADEAVEVEFASTDGDTNPAAIPMSTGAQLPIHMLVRRAIVIKAPIESSPLFDKEEKAARDDDEEEALDTEVSSGGPRSSVPNVIAVLRLFAAAYPEGLVLRDARGLTPLLAALLVRDSLPNVEIVEILLGKRSPGYESPPDWAQDMPLHKISGAKYMNPAMVPVLESNQLPLHVASEEMLSNYFLIESIHESYPGAIQIQDSVGKTPLHLALSNYRRIPVDPRVVSLLLTDRVAQTFDDDGNLPFDLLIENAKSLPSTQPRAWSFDESSGGRTLTTDASSVYERFFSASILGQGRPNNPAEAKFFLNRLRSLPVWLRRQACTASFVQELLIEELASPWKCAYVLFDGFLLGSLICVFRIQIQEFVDSIESGDVLSSWYISVYAAAASRLIFQAVLYSLSASLAEFQQAILLNGWCWIDGGAMVLTIVTSVLMYGTYDVDVLLTLSTVSTGLLWLSLIGYFARWWYGMAVLTGALSKVSYP
jgi:ankyrin repeat protein